MQKNRNRSQSGNASVATLVALVVLVVGGIALYGYAVAIQKQALRQEIDLGKVARVEISERATYETSITEQLGLAVAKKTALKEIVSAALEGRYGDNPSEGGLLFKAVAEAYPGTEGLNIYDKVLTGVQAGREAIRNKQNLRIEQAASYKYWLGEGPVRRRVLAYAGYPSNDLTFKVGVTNYRGIEALEKMTEPLSTASVNESFQTGIEKPVIQ